MAKKVALFLEIGRVKKFYHSPTRVVERVSEYKLKKEREYLWKI